MKHSIVSRVAALATLIIITFTMGITSPAFGQGRINVEWYQDKVVPGAVFSTPTTNIGGTCTSALAATTSYAVRLTIDNAGNASLVRDNILPYGPGGDTAYSVGPVAVNSDGTVLRLGAWINPSAQMLSAESIHNITINGVSIPNSVSANIMQQNGTYDYESATPIREVTFNYTIWAVSASSETGMGIQILSVPEPSSAAIVFLGLTTALVLRRRK